MGSGMPAQFGAPVGLLGAGQVPILLQQPSQVEGTSRITAAGESEPRRGFLRRALSIVVPVAAFAGAFIAGAATRPDATAPPHLATPASQRGGSATVAAVTRVPKPVKLVVRRRAVHKVKAKPAHRTATATHAARVSPVVVSHPVVIAPAAATHPPAASPAPTTTTSNSSGGSSVSGSGTGTASGTGTTGGSGTASGSGTGTASGTG